jgi:hypothetical protein
MAGLRDADHCFDGDLTRPSGRTARTRRDRRLDATPQRNPRQQLPIRHAGGLVTNYPMLIAL